MNGESAKYNLRSELLLRLKDEGEQPLASVAIREHVVSNIEPHINSYPRKKVDKI